MFPPRTILAATDFSESARRALQLAARLAARCGAQLHVLHVEDPLLVAAATEGGLDLVADTHAELRRLMAEVPEARDLPPHCDVVIGGAATAILHVAQREHADLIVLGARGLSGAGRLLFGSVTHQVLAHADRSTLVVPDMWELPADVADIGLQPIVVGMDCCEPSVLAARAACTIAPLLQATVEAVHVVPELSVLERWRPQAHAVMAERTDLARRDFMQLLSLAVPEIETRHVVHGDIAEQLAIAAAPIGGRRPLLMLGRRNHPATGAPGDIAQRVATIARVPVLMYRDSGS